MEKTMIPEPVAKGAPGPDAVHFGCSAVGDPACDLTIAWTFFFGESRDAFRGLGGG